MRKAIVLGLAGVLVGVMFLSLVPAQAHHNDGPLKRRISKLEARVASLEELVECLEALPIARYSGYQLASGGSTTALDQQQDTTTAPGTYALLIDPACVNPGTAKALVEEARTSPAVTKR